jgi:hypothetical protein
MATDNEIPPRQVVILCLDELLDMCQGSTERSIQFKSVEIIAAGLLYIGDQLRDLKDIVYLAPREGDNVE